MALEALSVYGDWGFLALRVALAAVFLYHGFPKLRSPKGMAKNMQMPTIGPVLIGLVEVLSSLSLLFGVYPRWGALGIGVIMLGALFFKIFQWKVPFSAQDQMGWEFDLALLAAALLLLTVGPGSLIVLL